MTLGALLEHGYYEEATDWREWLLRAVAGGPADLQIMYRVDGAGTCRSAPSTTSRLRREPPGRGGGMRRSGRCRTTPRRGDVRARAGTGRRASPRPTTPGPCSGTRRPPAPTTGANRTAGSGRSAVSPGTSRTRRSWRGLRSTGPSERPTGMVSTPPTERWRTGARRDPRRRPGARLGRRAADVRPVVRCRRTRTPRLLQLAQVGFLPPDDERIRSTVRAIRGELEVAPGLLRPVPHGAHRRRVPGDEHAFLACSFWLADALARVDDIDGVDRGARHPRPASPTTSACSPSSTTRSAGAWPGTCRRRSPTSPWSARCTATTSAVERRAT